MTKRGETLTATHHERSAKSAESGQGRIDSIRDDETVVVSIGVRGLRPLHLFFEDPGNILFCHGDLSRESRMRS